MKYIPDSVRDFVRKRAGLRCEYCHMPEAFSPQTHQIDHIISQKQGGSSQDSNLALACYHCNNIKGTDIAYYEIDANKLTLLFNPRKQKWQRHFQINPNGTLIGKTLVGRGTIFVLKMNSPDQVDARRYLIELGVWD